MKHINQFHCIVVLLAMISFSCANDNGYVEQTPQSELESRLLELYGSTDALILPSSNDYAQIPSDLNNPISEAKVNLGRFLFHETALATNPNMDEGMNMYSCASCHHVDAGFQSGIKQGIGEGGSGFGIHGEGRVKDPMYAEQDLDVQPIRTPSALNSAYQDVMLWNGQFGGVGTNAGTEGSWTIGTPKENNNLGFEGVETQAIAGLDVHRLVVNDEYIVDSPYKELFDIAFANIPEENRYTKINAALAIAAYERTLLPNQAPFQQWLGGNHSAMSDDEVEGALLFFGQANCFSCHSGPALNSMSFHALGMNDLAGNNINTVVDEATKKGRGGFTGNTEDDYKFKTPQLYNLMDVSFYGHGGSFISIEDIIIYKNEAVAENNEVPTNALSPLFVPLNLNEDQINKLTLFIENALYDNNLHRYVPEELPSGSCFPNADSQSQADLGCD